MTASDSKTEEAVGTANLYFRCAAILMCKAASLGQCRSCTACYRWHQLLHPCPMQPLEILQRHHVSRVSEQDWQGYIMEVHAMCRVPLQCAAAAERRECAVPEW